MPSLRQVTTRDLLPGAVLMLLACLWGIAQGVVYYRIAINTLHAREMGDFGVFYRSSERVVTGVGDPYDPSPARPDTPNLNLPHVVAWLTPLALIGPRPALFVWAIASLASAIAALWIVFRELGFRATPGAAAGVLCGMLIAAPTGAVLFTFQNAWLLWGPLTWAWSAARRGRWTAAAVALGIVMSVKPFLGLFVPMLIVTRRRNAALLASAAALVCILTGLLLGPSAYLSWWRAVRSVTWAGHVFNASSFGFFDRLFTDRTDSLLWYLAPIARAPHLIVPLWIVAAGLVCAAAVWTMRTGSELAANHSTSVAVDRLFAITTSTALLVTPLAWIYYEFFLVAPFLALAANPSWWAAVRGRRALLWVGVVSLILTPGLLAIGQPSGWASVLLGSAYFWGLLAFWICAMTPIERDGAGPRRHHDGAADAGHYGFSS